jgi:hypothetical protein
LVTKLKAQSTHPFFRRKARKQNRRNIVLKIVPAPTVVTSATTKIREKMKQKK